MTYHITDISFIKGSDLCIKSRNDCKGGIIFHLMSLFLLKSEQKRYTKNVAQTL